MVSVNKIEIPDGKFFVKAIKTLTKIHETMIIELKGNELHFYGMDCSKVAYSHLIVKLPPTVNFEFKREINIILFHDGLKGIKAKDGLLLFFDTTTNELTVQRGNFNYTIQTFQPDERYEVPLPTEVFEKIEPLTPEMIVIPIAEFLDSLKIACNISEEVTFSLKDEKFTLSSNSFGASYVKGINVYEKHEEVSAVFSTHYLRCYLNEFGKYRNDITLWLGNNEPVMFQYKDPDWSYVFKAVIAPRAVEEEEEEDVEDIEGDQDD